VNRGSNGWPCNDCDKWYCDGCRYGDNECEECNPHESSDETSEGSNCCEATKDEESKEEDEESPYTNIEEKVETSIGSDSCEATLEENAIMNIEDNDVAEPSPEPSSEPSPEPSPEPSADSTILLFA
jgi:hypothetical protein